MTRLLTCGWETGDVAEGGVGTVGANTTHTAVNATPTPRAGAYCLKIGNATSSGFAASYRTFALPAAKTEVWVRFAFNVQGLLSANQPVFAVLNDAAGTAQTGLYYDAADGLVRLIRGSSLANLLATAGTAFSPGTWNLIEWRNQVLTATTGVSEVWLNGNRVINFSGDNVATTNITLQTLNLGVVNALSGAGLTGAYLAYDDLAINDVAGSVNNGRAGDGRVVLLLPNGAGSSTQFVRGGTDTGANYSQVNEQPASMAQYVSSATVGQRDLYALQNLPVAVASINVVEAVSLTQNSDAGAGSIAHTIKSGATISEGATIGLATSAGFVTSRWETDPNGSVAWTAAAVDALEAGATIK